MNWKLSLVLIIILAVIVVCGAFLLNPQQPAFQRADDTGVTAEGISSVVGANNGFSTELYSKIGEQESGNIFFSPYSISTALAITYEGGRGQTAQEIKSVFNFPEQGLMRPAFARIYNDINSNNNAYRLSTANALWAQESYKFLDEYFALIGKYYGGSATNMDFIGQTENSRLAINKWVEEQTNYKIKDLLPQGTIDPMTRLVITNAVYFKGTWLYQFDAQDTKDLDFKITPDNIVKAPMMYLDNEDAKFNYTETDGMQILELPYKGRELSMLILLPNSSLESVGNITAEKIAGYRNMLAEKKIAAIYLPKFKFETQYFMKDTLSEMGMPTAFKDDGSADFSGMTGDNDLYISQVVHKAFVEVNEEGTEAAAATAVVMESTAMPGTPLIFRADHPFIFIIQQKSTGNILFFGRVVDPR